uniref:Uncharacterized protein n=1 Tax=Anopheles melas TaxID=34690 RepID=A0A182UHK0_9DIPT
MHLIVASIMTPPAQQVTHIRLLVLSQTSEGGIERLQTEVLLVLGRVGADLLERLEHVLGRRRRRRQMVTLRLESVLVGHVHHAVQHTIGAGVREGTVGVVRSETFLVGGDTVARLVAPVVVSIVLQHILVRHDLGVCVRVLLVRVGPIERSGGNGGHEQGSSEHEAEHFGRCRKARC